MRALSLGVAIAVLSSLGCENSAPRGVTVFAASSMTDALGAAAADYEARRETDVALQFAGSQQLITQVEHGARPDLLLLADESELARLRRDGRIEQSVIIAHNRLALVVRPEFSHAIPSLSALPQASRIILGAPQVPVGAYTQQFLIKAEAQFGPGYRERVLSHVVSYELSVRHVLSKVTLGEAEAGIVYVSDAKSAENEVAIVEIPRELNVIASYPLVLLRGAPNQTEARAFFSWLGSAASKRHFLAAGFVASDEGALVE